MLINDKSQPLRSFAAIAAAASSSSPPKSAAAVASAAVPSAAPVPAQQSSTVSSSAVGESEDEPVRLSKRPDSKYVIDAETDEFIHQVLERVYLRGGEFLTEDEKAWIVMVYTKLLPCRVRSFGDNEYDTHDHKNCPFYHNSKDNRRKKAFIETCYHPRRYKLIPCDGSGSLCALLNDKWFCSYQHEGNVVREQIRSLASYEDSHIPQLPELLQKRKAAWQRKQDYAVIKPPIQTQSQPQQYQSQPLPSVQVQQQQQPVSKTVEAAISAPVTVAAPSQLISADTAKADSEPKDTLPASLPVAVSSEETTADVPSQSIGERSESPQSLVITIPHECTDRCAEEVLEEENQSIPVDVSDKTSMSDIDIQEPELGEMSPFVGDPVEAQLPVSDQSNWSPISEQALHQFRLSSIGDGYQQQHMQQPPVANASSGFDFLALAKHPALLNMLLKQADLFRVLIKQPQLLQTLITQPDNLSLLLQNSDIFRSLLVLSASGSSTSSIEASVPHPSEPMPRQRSQSSSTLSITTRNSAASVEVALQRESSAQVLPAQTVQENNASLSTESPIPDSEEPAQQVDPLCGRDPKSVFSMIVEKAKLRMKPTDWHHVALYNERPAVFEFLAQAHPQLLLHKKEGANDLVMWLRHPREISVQTSAGAAKPAGSSPFAVRTKLDEIIVKYKSHALPSGWCHWPLLKEKLSTLQLIMKSFPDVFEHKKEKGSDWIRLLREPAANAAHARSSSLASVSSSTKLHQSNPFSVLAQMQQASGEDTAPAAGSPARSASPALRRAPPRANPLPDQFEARLESLQYDCEKQRQEFLSIITSEEDAFLEFKSRVPAMRSGSLDATDYQAVAFLRTVIAMHNTPLDHRDRKYGYIVFGVYDKVELGVHHRIYNTNPLPANDIETNDLDFFVSRHVNLNCSQYKLEINKFKYKDVQKGKSYLYVMVKVELGASRAARDGQPATSAPVMWCTKTLTSTDAQGKIKTVDANVVYYRENGGTKVSTLRGCLFDQSTLGYKHLYSELLHRFDHKNNRFVLVIPRLLRAFEQKHNMAALGCVPWQAVFDFDEKNKQLRMTVEQELLVSQGVHLRSVTALDADSVSRQSNECLWVHVAGDAIDVPESCYRKDSEEERAQRLRTMRKVLESLQTSSSETNLRPLHTVVIVLWNNNDSESYDSDLFTSFMNELREVLCGSTAEGSAHPSLTVRFFCDLEGPSVDRSAHMANLTRQDWVQSAKLPYSVLCNIMRFHRYSTSKPGNILVPGADESGTPMLLSTAQLALLRESFWEVVHLRIDLDDLSDTPISMPWMHFSPSTLQTTLFSAQATSALRWSELGGNKFVRRSEQDDLKRRIRSALDIVARSSADGSLSKVITLCHMHGAGGSTLARRIAFEFRETHPTLVLNGSYLPAESPDVDRIANALLVIAQKVKVPFFLVVDSLNAQLCEQLNRGLTDRRIKCVILRLERRLSNSQEPGNSSPIVAAIQNGSTVLFLSDVLREVEDALGFFNLFRTEAVKYGALPVFEAEYGSSPAKFKALFQERLTQGQDLHKYTIGAMRQIARTRAARRLSVLPAISQESANDSPVQTKEI